MKYHFCYMNMLLFGIDAIFIFAGYLRLRITGICKEILYTKKLDVTDTSFTWI